MKKIFLMFVTIIFVATVNLGAAPEDLNVDTHANLKVGGSCGMCKTRIEKTVKAIDGVTSAEWSLEKRELHIHFDSDKTNADEICKALAKVGHDTDKFKAEDSVYDALPGCCKYRTIKPKS